MGVPVFYGASTVEGERKIENTHTFSALKTPNQSDVSVKGAFRLGDGEGL